MTHCAICGQPFAPYRPQQVCCGPICRKRHTSAAATVRKRARRQAQHAPGATNGGRAVSGATIHHSGAPARLQRFGETAAIVPSETKPARTAPMTDAEFAGLLARERREIIERGGLLVDPDWKHKNVRGMGVSE